MALKPVTSPDTEAPTIQLTIDGQPVQTKAGVSLYDVISETGKIIPAMCYHYTFDPFGSCGMCLVMVEGKKAPVRSCTAKAEGGMQVRTEGDDLFQARKKAVEKHLTIHPLDCPVCDADGHCELQDMAFQHGVTNLVNAKPKGLPEDRRSLVLDFNMNRDRKSPRLNSSHRCISYAVFCLKKKITTPHRRTSIRNPVFF